MFESINELPLVQTMYKGGPVMVPLLMCSLIALAIVIERLVWGPRRELVLPAHLHREITRLIEKASWDELLALCRAAPCPLSRIIIAALENAGRPRQEVLEAVEMRGRKEAMDLQSYLAILGTIAAIGPLLGLLGTVFGMIETFSVVQSHGAGNPQALAGGISEALITTATGLTIGIPTLVFYRYFIYKSRKLVIDMETIAMQLISQMTRAETGGKPAERTAALNGR